MATTYLALLDGTETADALPAADWNKTTNAIDRQALGRHELFGDGAVSGWAVTSGTSTITSGTGQVGACWCATVTSQAISGLSSGTNYVFAKTDVGAAASGTVDFVARTTSAAVTNLDGVTTAVCLGAGSYNGASGFVSLDTSPRENWSIDHGGLSGLTDDDHPQYMQNRVVTLLGADAIIPATSGASTSSFGTNFETTAVKFPALSTTQAGWEVNCPADYSGAVTLTTDWVSSGLAGPIRVTVLARNVANGETWDAAVLSCAATVQQTTSGSNGQMMRFSHALTVLPTAGDRSTIVVRRVGANASDVMSGTARLLGATLTYETAL